jgi:hypothetical protein
MDAKKALQLSEKRKLEIALNNFSSIFNQIKKAALAGETSVVIDFSSYLHSHQGGQISTLLTELGYEVKAHGEDYRLCKFIVSWGSETPLKIKKAINTEEALKIQEEYKGKPHGWVQWKGTDVCMDVHCKCGQISHVDAEFAYYVKCSNCGTVYMCNGHIELIELEQEPEEHVITTEIEAV